MKYPTPKLAQAHKLAQARIVASMVIAPLFIALAGLIALSQPSVAQEDNQGRSSSAAKPAKSQPTCLEALW